MIESTLLYSTLAEEIGHYETALGDILNQEIQSNKKYVLLGRRWSYKKLIPYDQLKSLIDSKEAFHRYELAEEFGVPDDVIEKAIQMDRVEDKI